MSAFKKLNRQDVFVTAYTARKQFTVSGSELSSNDIRGLYVSSGSTNGSYYSSLDHLYYKDIVSGSYLSGSLEHYLQSSLYSGSRELDTIAYVVSLENRTFGTHIEPGTFEIDLLVTDYPTGVRTDYYTDDSEGRLISGGLYVGDIIYPHGLAVITDAIKVLDFQSYITNADTRIRWKSNHPIYIGNYTVKVRDYEFNQTQNPSIIVSGSDGLLQGFATGSDFNPYITGIGLYNDSNELIAVAKLGTPIPKSPDTDMTFVIKLDY